MSRKFAYVSFIGICLVALLGDLAWGNSSSSPLIEIAYRIILGAIVVVGALGTNLFAKSFRAKTRADSDDSVERHRASAAQSRVCIDALVMAVLIGVVPLVFGFKLDAPLAMIALVILMLIDFWIRYALSARGSVRQL